MTDMRDARFQKALQEAPDAGARPAPQLAQAIRDAAHNALTAPPRPVAVNPWWQRLWQNIGRTSAPWNASFATLLVGVLVTVMWVYEPVPDARPFADSAPAPTPIAAPAPVPVPVPVPVQVPPLSKMADAAQPAAPKPDQTLAATKAAAAVAAEEQSPSARLQKDASTESQSSRADVAQAAELAPAPAAAPAMPSALAAAAVAPAPMAQASADLSGLGGWTAMQIQLQGRTTTLNRAQAQTLFAGMVRLVRQMQQRGLPPVAPRTPSSVAATDPILRLTVLSQAQTQAVMVLWDDTVLWQRPTSDDVLASASAADVQALLQLARQALGADAPD